jgi:ribosomal protein S18 acetylase RimI-like enzyme
MVEIRQITQKNKADLNLKNEAFEMPGRFIPELKNGIWRYRTELFERPEVMTFPEEKYVFEELSAGGVAFGAYEGDRCIGVAIYKDFWFRYMYLYDLKVCASARRNGIGRALIRAGYDAARERGYSGIYTVAQDNNLNACMFYLKSGFEIGGFDNRVYDGTSQQNKADIYFYLK